MMVIRNGRTGLGWRLDDAKSEGVGINNPFAIVPSEANADFIVKACNCHADLYKALKAAVDFATSSGRDCGYNTVLFDAMVAAIAKAEGK